MVILKSSYDQATSDYSYALISTATNATQQITPPAGASAFTVKDLSADGKTVTGTYTDAIRGKTSFVWTAAGGFVDLGTVDANTTATFAKVVNGDGTAVAGYVSVMSFMKEAFYWTPSSGMVGLGTFGGLHSEANAISNDGSTVVGKAMTLDSAYHAFQWTVDSGTMENIDTLYSSSSADFVSSDGSVVAGSGETSSSSPYHVFRWTEATGMVDIGSLGGSYTWLNAMSGDGNVLVGQSSLVGGDYHAYRYTSSFGQITDLGTLGGTSSSASAVNADGGVVVGWATDAQSDSHGFRWTQATGMETVEDWLAREGATIGNAITQTADLVSADGNVIIGETTTGSTYIARVIENQGNEGGNECNADVCEGGSGIIDTAEFFPTVATASSVIVQSGVNSADTIMFGAQGAPMRNLLTTGQRSVWGTIDGGYDNGDHADGGLALGEFGFGYGIADGVTARFSAGATYTDQDLDAGGDVRQRGFYLSPEVSVDLGQNVYMTAGGYWGRSSVDSRRGYLSGAATDYSEGDTNAETWGAKIRFDWLNAVTVDETAITPYVGFSYAHTKVDAFTETGGSFPVEFDGSSDHSTIARLGADFVRPLNDTVRLLAKAELDYQFESHAAASTGTLTGISDFNLEGQDLQQFWARGGVGAEFDLGKGVASFMVNATTKGQDPTVWLRSNYTVKF
ncbi:autotransporter domain-containing protein [Aliirhizobium smilacinae]|uniref:autotransporter domain-containing protein n=1 Tax=Aliirhizobium smilacinae TaxID=1395944 RepID=UPI0015D60312|nr:autotransporter domain-containing protein [Rhizobium smilacinae]